MSRKTFYIAIFVVIIVTAVILNIWQTRARFVDVKIGPHYYHLEVADTQAKHEKGLSGRDALAQNEGMIFLLPYPARYSFWMKDMKFPLDFVWLLDDKIVDLTPNVQPPLSPPVSQSEIGGVRGGASASESGQQEPISYTPRQAVNRVIELNAGTISKESLKIGDVIQK
jgi:uncharacterized membrane protein (UPF0127 family)